MVARFTYQQHNAQRSNRELAYGKGTLPPPTTITNNEECYQHEGSVGFRLLVHHVKLHLDDAAFNHAQGFRGRP
jgi:hypothetical protein